MLRLQVHAANAALKKMIPSIQLMRQKYGNARRRHYFLGGLIVFGVVLLISSFLVVRADRHPVKIAEDVEEDIGDPGIGIRRQPISRIPERRLDSGEKQLATTTVDDITTSPIIPVTLQALLKSSSAVRHAGSIHVGNCRDDLPGCCPKNPKHVLFFHSQKTGGSSAAEWLLANGKVNGFRVMDKVQSLKSNDYFCACSFLKKAAAGQSVFDEADVLTSHMSLLLLDLMKPEELDQTLVVFSVRDPVARAVSGYNYLRNVIKRPDVLSFNSINDWIASDQEHAFDFRNGLATLLAHQQPGCRKHCGIDDTYAPPRNDMELLQQALIQLNRVCAVLVTEHMEESTSYLAHVLGWRASKPLQHINRTPKKDATVNRLSQSILSVANVADMGVYFEALQRSRAQKDYLESKGTGSSSSGGGGGKSKKQRSAS